MVIREARYLTPNDIGKTVSVESVGVSPGVMQGLTAHGNEVSIYFENAQPVFAIHIYGSTAVTITGTDQKEN